jgi:peptidoglycan/xylan/chitin deacetylase (PgdA/CDA1 family)
MYHGFTPDYNHTGIENYRYKHISIDQFRLQIEYLKQHYNIISLEELIGHYTDGNSIPQYSVVITIDDGYRSNYSLAYPVLKQFNVPAAIFLSTDFVDKKGPIWPDRIEYALNNTRHETFELVLDGESFDLGTRNAKITADIKIRGKLKSMPQENRSEIIEKIEAELGEKLPENGERPEIYQPMEWNEIREMDESGLVAFGSHSCSHPILPKCKEQNIEREMALSRQRIEQNTSKSCTLFCYPNGDFNDLTTRIAKDVGYSCALTTLEGMNNSSSDRYLLKRTGIMMPGGQAEFAMTVTGITKFVVDIKHSIDKLLSKKAGP